MKKIYFSTFGCKINQYETQVLREQWAKKGYAATDNIESADEILINSCTVTGEADRQCRQLIRKILKIKPDIKIYITGCYAVRAADEIRQISPQIEIINKENDIKNLNNITAFDGHSRAFVKIQDGCDAFCTYCIVPYVRPKLWSRPKNDSIKEIKNLIDANYSEIVLSGVHLGRYEPGLSKLLQEIVILPGIFRVRLSSLEINEISKELIDLMRTFPEKICPHLHLPIQSGSDKILKLMNRPYSIDKFKAIIEEIYTAIPDISITTDIITAFPGETEKDFYNTTKVIKDMKFSKLHVFRYSPRSGTAAASFQGRIQDSISQSRSKILRDIGENLYKAYWGRFIGASRNAVREGKKNTFLTDNYIRVNLESNEKNNLKSNSIVKIKIYESFNNPYGIIL